MSTRHAHITKFHAGFANSVACLIQVRLHHLQYLYEFIQCLRPKFQSPKTTALLIFYFSGNIPRHIHNKNTFDQNSGTRMAVQFRQCSRIAVQGRGNTDLSQLEHFVELICVWRFQETIKELLSEKDVQGFFHLQCKANILRCPLRSHFSSPTLNDFKKSCDVFLNKSLLFRFCTLKKKTKSRF